MFAPMHLNTLILSLFRGITGMKQRRVEDGKHLRETLLTGLHSFVNGLVDSVCIVVLFFEQL